jgi:hypothetical protein
MSFQLESDLARVVGQETPVEFEGVAATTPAEEPAVSPAAPEPATPSRYAEAGRKGARRIHQLIQEGQLYEKEHGLKRGRQRIRQLIELGKVYEEEHGLRAAPAETIPDRLARLSEAEALETFLHALVRLVKPAYRARLLEVVKGLEAALPEEAAQAS